MVWWKRKPKEASSLSETIHIISRLESVTERLEALSDSMEDRAEREKTVEQTINADSQ